MPFNLAPVATFGIYIIIANFWKDETLLSAQAFTSVALISLLTTPVVIFIQGMPQVLQSLSAFERIQDYCGYSRAESLAETIPDGNRTGSDIQLREMDNAGSPSHAGLLRRPVRVIGASLSWSKTSESVLHDVDIKFSLCRVTVIVGAVGSGKSALVNAIIGEMFTKDEAALPQGQRLPMAYCAQEPWLENSTIQNNITGPLPFDDTWYQTVKRACALDEDIGLLPSGDQTQIGTKGYSLSGGQKQRIVSIKV